VVALSTVPAQRAEQQQAKLITVSAAAGALLSVVVIFFSVGAWVRRLNRLVAAGERMSQGDFAQHIQDDRRDEIGRLAQTYERMRQAVRKFNDTLQLQVEERTRSLEEALKVAEAADKAKSMFLANMSHEIRTPLNGVVGMVDLLRGTKLDDQQQRFTHVARSSADALLSVINDILDFSKIEAGRIELESSEFDLSTVVEDLAETASVIAARKNIEVSCFIAPAVPDKVVGDGGRLGQILTNLTNNAIKFTESGQVVIRVTLLEQNAEDAMVKFTVTDSGVGIPQDRLDRLFHSFSQVDASTTRKYGGTGLGLAISKRLVEMMGGTIGVESEPGSGSTFWFTVRFPKSNAPAVAEVAEAKLRDARRARILVVDDNAVNREIVCQQLAEWNIEVRTTSDGPTALAMLRQANAAARPFDLAILDWHMPNMNGIELAKAVRASDEFSDTRLIMLTSIDDKIQADEHRALGLSGHLVKPVRRARLLNVIADVIGLDESAGAPEAEQPADIPLNPASPPSVRERATVLVAEDNDVNQLVAAEILKNAGYACELVPNGVAAVAAVALNNYDVILMDCQMPEMDGFEATKAIRAREAELAVQTRSPIYTPIIALTANAIKGDREVCLAAGMDGYVTKPINPAKLIEAIESLLPKRSDASMAADPPASGAGVDDPLDVSSLLDRCMGNVEFLNRLLKKFRNRVGSEVERLSQAVQAQNAQETAQLAHSLKGAAANVSAINLARIAMELEQLGTGSDWETATACLTKLREEVDRCIRYVPVIGPESATSPPDNEQPATSDS
jgi:signal transduction histidine kinase/DNA-binding response OmpR family regulator